MQRLVALISDFGTTDPYAGQMEAAVLAQAPDARVVSITHGIPPQDIALGAVVVAASLERLPPGAILVAVVDPGVGGRRRGLIVRAASRWLVGPDNGLLMGAGPPSRAYGISTDPNTGTPIPTPRFTDATCSPPSRGTWPATCDRTRWERPSMTPCPHRKSWFGRKAAAWRAVSCTAIISGT